MWCVVCGGVSCGVWCGAVFGVSCAVCGVWCGVVCGVWCVACGVRRAFLLFVLLLLFLFVCGHLHERRSGLPHLSLLNTHSSYE